jgi:hypothetical protein
MIYKKFISVFLIICTLICFSACKPEENEQTKAPVAETEVPETAKLVFIEDGKTDFKTIRSENAEGYYLDTARIVYRKLKDEYSADFKQGEDWINPLEPDPATAHEILLFDTNRAESLAAMADLTFDGYIIRVTDCKIVIVGSGISQCNAALNEFFYKIIPENTEGGVTAFPVGLEVKKELANEAFDFTAAISGGKSIGAHITEVFKYSGRDGFTSSQGATSDGKYVYIATKKKDGSTETDKIVKVNAETWEIVNISEELYLDHANDMTYDTARGQLAVVNMVGGVISFIETENLTVSKAQAHPFFTSAIEYIDENGQYLLRAGNGFIYTDGDLNQLSYHEVNGYPAELDKYTGQGMYADTSYLYIPRSPTAGLANNIIIVCDRDGNYLTTVTLATKMESETIFTIGEKFYVSFNKSCNVICEMEFYEVFE